MIKINKIFYRLSLFIAILLMVGFVLPDQNWEEITVKEMSGKIKEIESFYKTTQSYSIRVNHKTYRNHTTTVVEDNVQGYFIKDAKNNYHSFVLGIHTIQNTKIKVMIDSVNKQIVINEPDKALTKEVELNQLNDMLKTCSHIKMNDKEGVIKYRFEFGTKNNFSAYEIWANSSNQIKKLVIYFNHQVSDDSSDDKSAKSKPRGEVSFSDYKTDINPDYKKYFDETIYVSSQSGKHVGVGKYKTYEVYDLRKKD